MSFFKVLRIFILLFILFLVGVKVLIDRRMTSSWDEMIYISIYPINADGSEASAEAIEKLDDEDFLRVKEFLEEEAEVYEKNIKDKLVFRIAPKIDEMFPQVPENPNMITSFIWSLRMRYWIFTHDTYDGYSDIRMFVCYYDDEKYEVVPDSRGIKNGLYAIVNSFTNHEKTNRVIFTHELLHIFGATDKYDPQTLQPIFPGGYALPKESPVLPQQYAEIMGARRPITKSESEIPESLSSVVVGRTTAKEINWIK